MKSKRLFFAGTALAAGICATLGAVPFDTATFTHVENNVSVGSLSGGKKHSATISEKIAAHQFVQTGAESRAELEFKDKSLVRIGQNSVFTFDAGSRTFDLKKGDMLFYVPPGSGGGTIKTPAITAAITGTLCKVTEDMIAVLRGSLTLFCGKEHKKIKVKAGWAVRIVNGECIVFQFDPNEAAKGKLYAMGSLPEDVLFLPGPQIDTTTIAGQVNPNARSFPTNVGGPTTPPPPPPPSKEVEHR